ncbi:putative aldehyde dehydrogenase (NAD(+)) [Helianthus annuus]|nr:putative aldehyde dehydrogenase (NAD(+)) [Helianthus annuus]
MTDDHEIRRSVEELRLTFKSGKTRSGDWRKAQLQAILRLVHENEDTLFRLLELELGKHPVESYRDEIGFGIKRGLQRSLLCCFGMIYGSFTHFDLGFFYFFIFYWENVTE